MDSELINTADGPIVVAETAVNLTDEKLKGLLTKVYEQARIDASAFKLRKHYSAFLSAAATLFVALLTSSFRTIGAISGETLETVALIVAILSGVMGIVLMILNFSANIEAVNAKRDAAVDKVFSRFVLGNETE